MPDYCFVISQIGLDQSAERTWADITLEYIIEYVLARDPFNLKVERADDIGEPGLITAQIVERLDTADLVVADLTGRNPNVFYELAVRHLVRKPAVLMIREGENIPFDNNDSRVIQYDITHPGSVDNARKMLAEQARFALDHPEKLANPIIAALGVRELLQSSDAKDRAMGEVMQQLAEIKAAVQVPQAPPGRLRGIERILSREMGEHLFQESGRSKPFPALASLAEVDLSLLGEAIQREVLKRPTQTCALCGQRIVGPFDVRSADSRPIHKGGKCPEPPKPPPTVRAR